MMNVWMAITSVSLVALVWWLLRIVLVTQKKADLQRKQFAIDARNEFGLKFTEADKIDYEETKKLMYEALGSPSDAYHDGTRDPKDSWMRKLQNQQIIGLKAKLLKRAISIVPCLQSLPSHLQSKHSMMQRGLIGDAEWAEALKLREMVEREADTIQYEAECLQADWGLSKAVFRDALIVNRHQVIKKQNEEKSKNEEEGDSIYNESEMPPTLAAVKKAADLALAVLEGGGSSEKSTVASSTSSVLGGTASKPPVAAQRPTPAPGGGGPVIRQKGGKHQAADTAASSTCSSTQEGEVDAVELERQKEMATRMMKALIHEEEMEKAKNKTTGQRKGNRRKSK